MLLNKLLGLFFAASESADFEWDSITPSTNLEFHPCFGQFECARLRLPLDWTSSDGRTVAIAITRLPADVAPDDPCHAGTIIAQPGGPGVSGVVYLQGRHGRLRQLVDIPGRRHHDLVSFDPRGVNNSEPRIRCFQGLAAHMRSKERQSGGELNFSNESLAIKLAAAKADGEECLEGNGDFLRFVGTADVARDMLAIVDKLEQVNKARGGSRLELRATESHALPRLNYIGISYGTLLGNYFASMFPGRVGRMVLDGLCDAPEYAHEQGWVADGDDAGVAAQRFFDGCFSAGLRCPLYRQTDSSSQDMLDRFNTWKDGLDINPLVVSSPQGHRVILRSSDIALHFLRQLYNAEYQSQFLARFFHDAMTSPSTLYARYADMLGVDVPADACSADTTDPGLVLDTQSAIACSDADDLTGRTYSYWWEYVNELHKRAPFGGLFGAAMRIPCSGWPRRAKTPFKGPFKTPKASKELLCDAPAAPLLFMSNRWDPVTPLGSARRMARLHPGSGVLVQEATGHCVSLGPFGDCVRSAVSRYFETGEVPEGELICESTRNAWDEEI